MKIKDLPANCNILGGRFTISIKNPETEPEKYKARFVAQGHLDPEKPFMFHDTPILRAASIRTVRSVASNLAVCIFLDDVDQAYRQSKEKLTRSIAIKPHADDIDIIGIHADEVLKLKNPFYVLCDAGDYWERTISNHIKNRMGMIATLTDPSLYMKFDKGQLVGILGMCVDNSIITGTKDIDKFSKSHFREFKSKPRKCKRA